MKACVYCGCTDDAACEYGCCWITDDPRAICSQCWGAEEIAKRLDRKSTRLNSSHIQKSRMPSSA